MNTTAANGQLFYAQKTQFILYEQQKNIVIWRSVHSITLTVLEIHIPSVKSSHIRCLPPPLLLILSHCHNSFKSTHEVSHDLRPPSRYSFLKLALSLGVTFSHIGYIPFPLPLASGQPFFCQFSIPKGWPYKRQTTVKAFFKISVCGKK